MMRRVLLALPLLALPLLGASPASAQRCDTRFDLENRSGETIEEFYFSPSSERRWGVDQLGSDVLPPGRTMRYTAADPVNYDFRIVWQNGDTVELRDLNICQVSRIIATRNGARAE